ncbi:MAG: hypothetical protein IJ719_08310 [Clostridia bacterium]|nr:hypothetical protein [Clostridia bacterium]
MKNYIYASLRAGDVNDCTILLKRICIIDSHGKWMIERFGEHIFGLTQTKYDGLYILVSRSEAKRYLLIEDEDLDQLYVHKPKADKMAWALKK